MTVLPPSFQQILKQIRGYKFYRDILTGRFDRKPYPACLQFLKFWPDPNLKKQYPDLQHSGFNPEFCEDIVPLSILHQYTDKTRVADPGGLYNEPDPDPTCEKKRIQVQT